MIVKKVLPDNCPLCGSKMEKGYLRCKTPVWVGDGSRKEKLGQGLHALLKHIDVRTVS